LTVNNVFFSASIALAGLVLSGRILQLSRRWRLGRAAGTSWLAGLPKVPRRYLHDVHEVVAREPRTARMHGLLAGGFLASLVLVLVGLATARHQAVSLAMIATLGAAVAGLWLQARRRLPVRPARLSGGAWAKLTPALAGASLLFLAYMLNAVLPAPAATMPIGLLLLVAVPAWLWLALSVARGPMRHALAGSLNLAVHSRPARFAGTGIDSGLAAADLDAESLGVKQIGDFGWNRLVSFDACVQCGRCEAACPAFAAGAPLNPKKLLHDLASSMNAAETPITYSGSAHPGTPVARRSAGHHAPLVLSLGQEVGLYSAISSDTLWSCTTCRACVHECPMMIEHVDAIVDLRRNLVMERGEVPGKAPIALENLAMTDTICGADTASRLDWAVDLDLPRIRPEVAVDMLLWIGEAGFDLRNQRSLRAFVALLHKAGADFAVLENECDTGDLARRLGDEVQFQRLALDNIARLSLLRFRRIVTMDPHAMHTLSREYGVFGGHYDVQHHTQVLNELLREGRLQVARPLDRRVTYHDPCYLGRYNGQTDTPRALLDLLGATRVEMEFSGMRSRCCGGGGGAPWTDIGSQQRIPDMRMDQAHRTGADLLVTACPFCTQMLEGVPGREIDIVDIAEILLPATEMRP
jgi:Fe-S oxidoreductase